MKYFILFTSKIQSLIYPLYFRYQIAVGTSPGGGQIQSFIPIPLSSKHYTVGGLNLNGQRQVRAV